MRGQLLRVFGLGAGIGVLLTIATIIFGWDFALVSYYYWRVAIVALVLIAVGYTAYYLYHMHKLKPVMNLFEERKYDDFVGEMKRRIEQTRNAQLQRMMKLNLGAGYIEQHAYNEAIRLYDKLDPEGLNSKQLQLVYYLNLMIAYFKLGEMAKFEKLYVDHGDLLTRYARNKNYRESILQVEIYNEIAAGDLETAEKKLEELRLTISSPRYRDEYERVKDLIQEKRDDSKKMLHKF